MLIDDRSSAYVVIPSWAKLAYRWDELGDFLENPSQCRILKRLSYDWVGLGYPAIQPPFMLIAGSLGGGIVKAEYEEAERWLPNAIFSTQGSLLRPPLGMENYDRPRVDVVQPADASLGILGLSRTPVFACFTSVDHVEAADDDVFWFFQQEKHAAKQSIAEHVAAACSGFDTRVLHVPTVSGEVKAETAGWLRSSESIFTCLQVLSADVDLAAVYSKMIYVGYSLCSRVELGIVSVSLISRNDRRLKGRSRWTRQPTKAPKADR